MIWDPLPVTATQEAYEQQAMHLLQSWRDGEKGALRYFKEHLPRLMNPDVPWLPRGSSEEEIRAETFSIEDARAALARGYDFADWDALKHFATAMEQRDQQVYPFELAVDAVVDGDAATLSALLQQHPELAAARSSRVTWFDPPVHAATLLIYLGANGIENYRQRTPKNAVEIATLLLDAGADVNAEANLYGAQWTTLGLLASSSHPAAAGLQIELLALLVARGAQFGNALQAALVHGFRDAAKWLAKAGAPVGLAEAAALGEAEQLRKQLNDAGDDLRQRALALAAQWGEVETAALLLDAGADPSRFNPPGTHAHTTPLHQAAWAGHLEMARLLVNRGAKLDIRDKIYHSTPLGWARYAGKTEVAAWLEGVERQQ
jgi:ankyrin repeat protein